MQRWLTVLAATAVVCALVGVFALTQVNRWLEAPLDVPAEGALFEIPTGSAMGSVSKRLAEEGIVDRPLLFTWYARITGAANSVQAGEYSLEPGVSAKGLLQKFVDGDVRLHSFTIIEGWTFRELLDALAADDTIEATFRYDDWPELLARLGASESHPEGLFLPETYRYPAGTTDVELLRQSYELMQATLRDEWQARAGNLPLQRPYEALILASIVEKETGRADERARIAGVFVRRLQKRMRLQTDPTVIYGIGTDFDGNLTRRDLRTDTEYNTYTRAGLPPTPIALPGRAAIHAALHPAPGKELYFVATGLGDGSHQFSETMEQHNAAVQAYLARQRAGGTGR